MCVHVRVLAFECVPVSMCEYVLPICVSVCVCVCVLWYVCVFVCVCVCV